MRNAIYRAAWPIFACTDCIGMMQYGCQCAFYEAFAPGVAPTSWHRFLRILYNYAWNNILSDRQVAPEGWGQFS